MKTNHATLATRRRGDQEIDERVVDARAAESLDAIDRLMRQMFSEDFLRMKAENFVSEVLENEDAESDEFRLDAGQR